MRWRDNLLVPREASWAVTGAEPLGTAEVPAAGGLSSSSLAPSPSRSMAALLLVRWRRWAGPLFVVCLMIVVLEERIDER